MLLYSIVLESWQSGNAPDSKSGEPANTGAQVQILYSPLNSVNEQNWSYKKPIK